MHTRCRSPPSSSGGGRPSRSPLLLLRRSSGRRNKGSRRCFRCSIDVLVVEVAAAALQPRVPGDVTHSRPCGGVPLQHAREEVDEGGREAGRESHGGCAESDALFDLLVVCASEGEGPDCAGVEHDAQGPDVSWPALVRPARKDLRGCVHERAAYELEEPLPLRRRSEGEVSAAAFAAPSLARTAG
jgi:hypothetical protein